MIDISDRCVTMSRPYGEFYSSSSLFSFPFFLFFSGIPKHSRRATFGRAVRHVHGSGSFPSLLAKLKSVLFVNVGSETGLLATGFGKIIYIITRTYVPTNHFNFHFTYINFDWRSLSLLQRLVFQK